jgi:hypothetical protein
MLINNEHQQAQVQGVTSTKFGFEMNAKMYDILISKMYTNKQGAVIRELSSNASDAHGEAGKSDVPFDLHLPTWLDKSFWIRDYGTGIPHHMFEHIYTNVGSSTKEDSNEFIGGFGLGSKTPFTMTDTFMVENHYSGVKTTWVCFKDKGEPQVSKVAEEPTDEPSGLKVSFSFDEGDVPEFTRQVVKQLRFFPVKPNITGGEGTISFPDLPDGWETQEYFYTNTRGSGSSYDTNYVVMGNVAYILDSNMFDYSLRSLFHNGLTIKVPIGAVDIPPSREHLEMTPRTKAYISEVLGRIKKEYAADLQKKVDKCTTQWELRKVLFDINDSLLSHSTTITWKGAVVEWKVMRARYLSHVSGYSSKIVNKRYANVLRLGGIYMRTAIDGKNTYYVNDLGVGGTKHVNDTFRAHDWDSVIIFHVDGIKDKTKDALITTALDAIEAEIGVRPKLLSSLLGFPVKKARQKNAVGKPEPNQVFTPNTKISNYTSMKNQMKEQDTLPTDGYYVEIKLWQLQFTGLARMLTEGLTNFLDKPLYFVRAKTIKKLDKTMVPLTKDILLTLKDSIVSKHKELMHGRNIIASVHRIPMTHRTILPAITDKGLKAYIRYSSGVLKKVDSFQGDTAGLHSSIFNTGIDYTPVLPPRLETLKAQYDPIHDLLCCVCSSYNTERNEKRLSTLASLLTNQ